MSLLKLNPIEPPWYGPVCPVVWEGWHREVSPYPDPCPLAAIANTCPSRRVLPRSCYVGERCEREDGMRRRHFFSLLGGTALVSLPALPAYADPPDGCVVPVARDDGWPVASVNEDKLIDRDALCRMADRLVASSANVHAVLVARGGKLVFERYFKGSDEINGRRVDGVAFDVDTLHNIKSATKSVASLALGITIDRGLIRSVNEPIFSFFPELSDLRSPEKDRIQLVHALTMSMGLQWVEATPSTGENNDESRMHVAPDMCRYVLGLPVTAPAGQEFFYNTGALALITAIMH